MSTIYGSKINHLLQNWPRGTVGTSVWLKEQGINSFLKRRYESSHWVESIGYGAVTREGDTVAWQGALYALQSQLHIPIHVGGKTALEMQGYSHFIKFAQSGIHLYFQKIHKLPAWFIKNKWGVSLYIHKTQFLRTSDGIISHQVGDFTINISGPERAFLETLYLVPKQQDLKECYYLFENLIDIRPVILQSLLEKANSIKVKRLFFFLADKVKHPWHNRLDKSRIDLGSGKRMIVKGGIFDNTYMITVPKDLADDIEN